MEHRVKHKLADSAVTFCIDVNLARTPSIFMIAAAARFDAICVDREHNPTSLKDASMLFHNDVECMRTTPVLHL